MLCRLIFMKCQHAGIFMVQLKQKSLNLKDSITLFNALLHISNDNERKVENLTEHLENQVAHYLSLILLKVVQLTLHCILQ